MKQGLIHFALISFLHTCAREKVWGQRFHFKIKFEHFIVVDPPNFGSFKLFSLQSITNWHHPFLPYNQFQIKYPMIFYFPIFFN